MKEPKIEEVPQEDNDNYLDLLHKTDAKFSTNKQGEEKIAAPRRKKLKLIEKLEGKGEGKVKKKKTKCQKKKTQGKGFLPSDPNALCERLELSMAAKQAGNTGFRNEIVSICD